MCAKQTSTACRFYRNLANKSHCQNQMVRSRRLTSTNSGEILRWQCKSFLNLRRGFGTIHSTSKNQFESSDWEREPNSSIFTTVDVPSLAYLWHRRFGGEPGWPWTSARRRNDGRCWTWHTPCCECYSLDHWHSSWLSTEHETHDRKVVRNRLNTPFQGELVCSR